MSTLPGRDFKLGAMTAESHLPPAPRRRLPQGNPIVLAVLRSRAHRLLSGAAIELRYVGRRSGREFVLPVEYARLGEHLVVRPQGAESKTWWRNFLTDWPVTVRLAGRVHRGTARVVNPEDAKWEQVRAAYAARWKRREVRPSEPFVVITLDG
jgi:deazaflavin-dependent oxidoreductase (nitroreductase family)